MYSFGEEMVIEGDITAIWQAVTDAAAWPSTQIRSLCSHSWPTRPWISCWPSGGVSGVDERGEGRITA